MGRKNSLSVARVGIKRFPPWMNFYFFTSRWEACTLSNTPVDYQVFVPLFDFISSYPVLYVIVFVSLCVFLSPVHSAPPGSRIQPGQDRSVVTTARSWCSRQGQGVRASHTFLSLVIKWSLTSWFGLARWTCPRVTVVIFVMPWLIVRTTYCQLLHN